MSNGTWGFEDMAPEQPGNCWLSLQGMSFLPSQPPQGTVEPEAPGPLYPEWHIWGLNTHDYNRSDRPSKAPDQGILKGQPAEVRVSVTLRVQANS